MRKDLLILAFLFIANWSAVFGQSCAIGEDQVVIKIDANGNFTANGFSWSLIDNNGQEVIAYQAGYYSDFTITQDTICLTQGNEYTFKAFDALGAGWSANGSSFASIYYSSDGFPLYYDSPDNGNLSMELPEVAFTFEAGTRPGLDCTQPKEVDIYSSELLITNAFNTNASLTNADSGKDVILSFTPPSDDSYRFSVSNVATPTYVSLQLLDDCIDGAPGILGAGQSSPSLLPFSFNASLLAGTTYYLLFSNDMIASGADTAQARIEITYDAPPIADECSMVALTMDGASAITRFAEAGESGPAISFTALDGFFYQSDTRDIFYDFNLDSYDVVVEVQNYQAKGELFAKLSIGGCPVGSVMHQRVTFEGTTRRFDFKVNPGDANLGDPISLTLAEAQFDNYNKPFSVKIRSKVVVESEFPINPNNNCASAIAVPVNKLDNFYKGIYPTSVLMSNYNAANSGLAAPCGQDSIYTGTTADVWVKAIVPKTGVLAIEIDGELAEQMNEQPLNIAWALYTGSCGGLTEYYCSPTVTAYQSDTVGGLAYGEEVFIRLFDRGGLRQGDFNINIQETGKLEIPNPSFLTYTDSISIVFNEFNFLFDNYLLDVSIDSFATFLPGFENVVIDKSLPDFPIDGLSPNTAYFIRFKKMSSNIGESDYFFEKVKSLPLEINTVAAGNWNNPAIWEGGLVPPADSAVNIFHKVVVTPGSDITIEAIKVSHEFDGESTIGLFVEDANFTVERDVEVTESLGGYSVVADTLGVIITNNSGANKSFKVKGNVRMVADDGEETQFLFHALNNSGSLNVTVEGDFEYYSPNAYSFAENDENILLDGVDFTANALTIEHDDDFEGFRQSFKALFHNSTITVNNNIFMRELSGDLSTLKTFEILFTGNSLLDLKGDLTKEYGGKIKFLDNSTLELSGIREQYISGYDPMIGQDSILLNNLIINNSMLQDVEEANGIFKKPSIYLLANSSSGTGQLFMNGQLSFLSGVATTLNGTTPKNVELVLSAVATLDLAYDGSNDSYFKGVIAKYGLSDFTFPLGGDFGPRIISVNNSTATDPTRFIKLAAFTDACQDSTFTIAGGIQKARIQDFWMLETDIQEVSVTADFTFEFPDLVRAGIANTAALRMLDFENGIDLGNDISGPNSFTSSYNFDNGLMKVLGIGSVDNSNSFYKEKTVLSISAVDVIAGDNIVFTYSGNYASTNDVVYFEQIPATTVTATSNTITVTVPNGARSGEPVIVLGDNSILQVDFMVNVREGFPKTLLAQQFDSLVLIDNIGFSAFGESKLQLSDINNNGDYDFIGIRQGVDSIFFVKDLGSVPTSDYFYINSLDPGEYAPFRDISVNVSNAFGTPTVDVATYVQFFDQQIQVYLFNDGGGNFLLPETEGYGDAPKIRSPFIRDINGDGFSDFNFTLNGVEAQYNGLFSSALDNPIGCNVYESEYVYVRGDQQTIDAVSYGNFGELQQTLTYAYIPDVGEIVLSDPNSKDSSFIANISVTASLTDFHKAAINKSSKAQYIALDTVMNSIEIFDGFTAGSILNTSIALSFSPGRMAIEDLNGDGFADIVVSERGSANLFFLENTTAGNFVVADSLIGAMPNIVDLEIADVSQDGHRDIVMLLENGDVYIAYFNELAIPAAPLVAVNNITTNSFDMSWSQISGAESYEIEVSFSSDTLVNLVSDSIFHTSDTLISFDAPIPFETYFLHARSINAASDTSSYAIPVQVNLLPLVAPSVGLVALDANTIEINVGAVEGADAYELFISLDEDSVNNDVNDASITVNDGITNFTVPEYAELYYVYARSIANGVDTSGYDLSGNVKLPISAYFALDSLALVSLYQSAGGANWINNDGWLTEKVNKWAGINMNADTVKAINLSANNLKGSVADSLNLLSFLESINVADNELSSLGDISNLGVQLVSADVSNNQLSFEELEVLQSASSYQFAGQQFQYTMVKDTLINLLDDITFSPESFAVANNYQWFKNGAPIEAATLSSLTLNNVTKAEEGDYYLQVTNSVFSGITLLSDTVNFKVSTLERDIAALKSLYATANGSSWTTVKWDTAQVNPVNWSASATDIIVENNRIVGISLPNNNLSGSVSAKLAEMLGLRSINLSNNKINSLAKISRLPVLTTLNMDGNQLEYDDIEKNISINGFTFENQKLIGPAVEIEKRVGSSIDLNFEIGGTANTYQWYLNDELIPGAIMDSLHIDSLNFETKGKYQLLVKNSIINAQYPDFKLSSAVSEINVVADLSGKVTDANGFATTAGKLSVFEITSSGSYDTVLFQNNSPTINLNSDGTYQVENLRLGDYILLVKPNQEKYPKLLPTYFERTIDWDLATSILFRDNKSNVNVIMEGTPQALTGTSLFSGYLEEEFAAGDNGRSLPRRRVGGAGVSVRRLSNTTRGETEFNGVLVAFTETDENGEFSVENLPAGDYISKIDYPGIPMNESSDIRFTMTGENMESLEVAAVVDQGICTMETILYTSVHGSEMSTIQIYPNPFKDMVSITGDLNQLSSVYVYDINGQLMMEVGVDELVMRNVLDLSSLNSGMYLINVNWKNGFSSSSKIIKE